MWGDSHHPSFTPINQPQSVCSPSNSSSRGSSPTFTTLTPFHRPSVTSSSSSPPHPSFHHHSSAFSSLFSSSSASLFTAVRIKLLENFICEIFTAIWLSWISIHPKSGFLNQFICVSTSNLQIVKENNHGYDLCLFVICSDDHNVVIKYMLMFCLCIFELWLYWIIINILLPIDIIYCGGWLC